MKNFTLILFCMISMMACKPKNEATNANVDSTLINTIVTVQSDVDTLQKESVSDDSFIPDGPPNGIFVLPGTTVYSDSTLNAVVKSDLNDIKPARILSSTMFRYPEDEDFCNQYPLYEARFEDDETTGWITGDNVLLEGLSANNDLGHHFNFRGKSYSVSVADDTGVGVSDKNGLTGCNKYQIVYFVNQQNNKKRFVWMDDTAVKGGVAEGYHDLFSLISSNGGSSSISSVESDHDEIRIILSVHYQDGGDTVIIHITETEGDFHASTVEVEAID